MNEHICKYSEVSFEEVRQSELELKNHSRNWAKVLSIGKESGEGQHRRCCRALVNNHTSISVLQGLRKDYK